MNRILGVKRDTSDNPLLPTIQRRNVTGIYASIRVLTESVVFRLFFVLLVVAHLVSLATNSNATHSGEFEVSGPFITLGFIAGMLIFKLFRNHSFHLRDPF